MLRLGSISHHQRRGVGSPDDDQLRAPARDLAAQLLVGGCLLVAEFDEPRRDHHAAPRDPEGVQEIERGARAGRIGVEGVVDQHHPRGCGRHRGAIGDGRQGAEASGQFVGGRPQFEGRGQRAGHVGGLQPGDGGDLCDIESVHPDPPEPFDRRDAHVGGRIGGARGAHAPLAQSRRPGGEARVVRVHDDHAGLFGDLELRALDHVQAAHALEVHRTDGGDHRDLGRAPGAQRRYFAGAVGAHLGDEDAGAVGQVLVDRTAQSGAVVEALGRGDHSPVAAQQVGQVVLRRGLAVGAGDRHHQGVHPREALTRLVDEAARQSVLVGLERGGREPQGEGHRPDHEGAHHQSLSRDHRGEADRGRDYQRRNRHRA